MVYCNLGSVLGPFLFMFFIDDINEKVLYKMFTFVDTKIAGQVKGKINAKKSRLISCLGK